MCFRTGITPSTETYWEQIRRLRQTLSQAEALVIGAGAGMSASAGLDYSGARFREHFGDFIEKYHYNDMYSAGFYPYASLEEYWAYWSRHIYWNRYDRPLGEPYNRLMELIRERDYFIITTNVDHCFQQAGADKKRLFYTQGDYGLWQCSRPCHQKTYENEKPVRQMLAAQKDLRIPRELVPRCPVCGSPMAMNLRCDETFVQDQGWHEARARYEEFLRAHSGKRILFLELGVGGNTPVIIKFPFWEFTHENPNATYACINSGEAYAPGEIAERSLCINQDIGRALRDIEKHAV